MPRACALSPPSALAPLDIAEDQIRGICSIGTTK